MAKTFKQVSKAELERKLEVLKEELSKERYTIRHMAFLTGWTRNYLRILERRGDIPKAERRLQRNNVETRYWKDDGARAILAFKEGQEKKKTRTKG